MEFTFKFLEKLDGILQTKLLHNFRLIDLITLVFLLILVVLVERFLRRYIVRKLLRKTNLEPASQFAISRIFGYAFVIFGVYISLQIAHVDMSSFTILAGALGVGIGFGLQNIISNFISGLIILTERPISLGDRIEVGGVAGQVKKISLRSTTVITNDNIAIIVPNANFVTDTVTNWSHGDPKVRFRIPFGVAYGTDLEKLKRLMLEVAAEHPKAMKEPGPDLFFIGFGDSSMNFELSIWTSEMTFSPRRFRSELYFAIEKKLRDNSIEIPFPQRDIHVRSGLPASEKAAT